MLYKYHKIKKIREKIALKRNFTTNIVNKLID